MKVVKGALLLLLLWAVIGFVWWKRHHDADEAAGASFVTPEPPPPADVDWTAKNEQHWLISQIAREIAGILSYSKDPAAMVDQALKVTTEPPSKSGGEYRISAERAQAHAEISITLARHLWAPENFIPWAGKLLAAWSIPKPQQNTPSNGKLILKLATSGGEVLIKESKRISLELSQHPLNGEMHEEAALVQGYLALCEAAGRFADTRPMLCRMSAHLAVARALQSDPGPCGKLAEAIQLCLVNREAEALEKIAGFPTELAVWATALKMRCTGDWRMVAKPETAGHLELAEGARAVVRSVEPGALADFLKKANATSQPQWNRIIMEGDFSVQDGHVFAKDSLAAEMQDVASDWKAWWGTELKPESLVTILNDAVTGPVVKAAEGKQQIEVLSWGDLAAFHQRHVCHSVQRTVYFLRDRWGVPEDADEFESTVDARLAGLKLYPLLQKRCSRTSGQYATAMKGAVALCSKQPELVTAANWACLRTPTSLGSQYARVADPLAWFSPVLPVGTAIDFFGRYYELHRLYQENDAYWDALLALAPYDIDVILAHHYKKHGSGWTLPEAGEWFSKVGDYQLRAMKETADSTKGDAQTYEKYLRKACDLDPDLYVELGYYLVQHKQLEDAAFAYQAAFEMARDRVYLSNHCDWIVNYYFDHNRKDDALKIATDAAAVYSSRGLETMAHLMERMEKLDEAQKYYANMMERYGESGPLNNFILRHQDKDPKFAEAAKEMTAKVFPGGMEKVGIADFSAAPPDGVVIQTTNAQTNRAGLKRGDVFVALDGWRVHNMAQYYWVRELSRDPELKLIAWNGKAYVQVNASPPNRRFGNDIENYTGH